MAFHVYILINPEGKTYVGQTQDLHLRIAQHNDPAYRGTLHTKRHMGPWELLHSEEFATRSEAMQREKELKTGVGRDFINRIKMSGC